MNELSLEITGTAYSDIEKITDFIAKDSNIAAIKMTEMFYKTFLLLCLYPNLGKIRKDFTYKDVRFYVLKKKYLLVYSIINSTSLRILRVLTTYQDICAEL